MPENNKIDNQIKPAQEDEISLKELVLRIQEWWYYLLSKWKPILLTGLLGGLLGLGYALLRKPLYTAELSFVMEDQKGAGGALGAYAGIASQFGINLGGMEGQGLFTGDNIMEFLKSRRMIQKTLLSEGIFDGKKMLLVDKYLEFKKIRQSWDENPKLKNFQFLQDTSGIFLQDSLLGIIHQSLVKENIVIDKPDKKLNIIALEVESEDELFSKVFAEKLISTVSNFYIYTRTKKSEENLAVLTKQVDSVRRELNHAIGGVAAATEANPNANQAFQSLRVASQRRSVDVQANTAILTELVKNQELARMTLRNDRPLIQILDRPILPLEKAKVGKIKGILVGGILAGILITFYFIIRRIFNLILNGSSPK